MRALSSDHSFLMKLVAVSKDTNICLKNVYCIPAFVCGWPCTPPYEQKESIDPGLSVGRNVPNLMRHKMSGGRDSEISQNKATIFDLLAVVSSPYSISRP